MRFARSLTLGLLGFACPGLPLFAAEFWDTKAPSEWNEKEIQRLVTKSPWARQGRAIQRISAAPDASRPSDNSDGPSRGIQLDQRPPEIPVAATTPTLPVTLRWITAAPLKQIQVRAKYGKDTDSNPEAKKALEQKPTIYMISVAGLSGFVVGGRDGSSAKSSIMASATLTARGRQLKALGVELLPVGPNVDVLIGFPRNPEITLADEEVEFSAQIGELEVRYKFKLKDMVYKGQLEL